MSKLKAMIAALEEEAPQSRPRRKKSRTLTPSRVGEKRSSPKRAAGGGSSSSKQQTGNIGISSKSTSPTLGTKHAKELLLGESPLAAHESDFYIYSSFINIAARAVAFMNQFQIAYGALGIPDKGTP